MKMKPPFTLVPDTLSRDTKEALEQLLEMAKRGELIGIAFAGMVRRRQYFVNSAGEAHRNPVFARGMVDDLMAELRNRS